MAVLVHFASCCVVPIIMYSVLDLFILSFMPCIQLLMDSMETTVKLMIIGVGMPQFHMLINDRENRARVLCELNRT